MPDTPHKTFRDTEGRVWAPTINMRTLKRVRDELGVMPDALSGRMRSDPVLACDVLYLACERQARERGVSDETFGEMLAGDVLPSAMEALGEAFARFAPTPQEAAPSRGVTQTAATSGEPSTG